MNRILREMAMVCALLFTVVAHARSPLDVNMPIIRTTVPTASNTAAYMVLTNNSEDAVTITNVSTEIATKTELHATVKTNNLSRMEAIGDLTLQPGEHRVFQPGQDHVMLMGLKEPVTDKSRVVLTFKFADGRSQSVRFTGKKME